MFSSIKKNKSNILLVFVSLLFVIMIINIIMSLVSKNDNKKQSSSMYGSLTTPLPDEEEPEEPVPVQQPSIPDEECRDDNGKISLAKKYKFNVYLDGNNHNYIQYMCPPVCKDESYSICDSETHNICCKRDTDKNILSKTTECNFGSKKIIGAYGVNPYTVCTKIVH